MILNTQPNRRKGELVEILSNTMWEMVYLATTYASILAYLEIFKALQTFIESKWTWM
jgi:hypothetical protein